MAHIPEWYHIADEVGEADRVERSRRALVEHPDNMVARTSLAMALFNRGNHEEAFVEVNEAIRLNPSNVLPYTVLGAMLAAQGKTQEAVTVQRKAVSIYPDDPSAQWSLAFALDKNGQRNDARECWEKVITLCERNSKLARPAENVMDMHGLAEVAREMLKIYPKE